MESGFVKGQSDNLPKFDANDAVLFCMESLLRAAAGLPSWQSSQCSAALTAYLGALVRARGWELPAPHWDLACLAAAAALTALHRHLQQLQNTKISSMAVSVLRLIAAISTFTAAVPARCLQEQPSIHVAALPREWKDVFVPDIRPKIHDILLHVLRKYNDGYAGSTVVAVAAALCEVLSIVTCGDGHGDTAARAELTAAAAAALGPTAAAALGPTAAAALGPTATPGDGTTHAAVAVLAYRTLLALAPKLRGDDERAVSEWGVIASEASSAPPPPSLAARTLAGALCSSGALQGPCVRPLGPLLLAEALYQVTAFTDSEETSDHYYQIYKEHQFVQWLVPLALENLPAAVARYVYGSDSATASAKAGSANAMMFLQPPDINVTDHISVESVQWVWCRSLFTSLSGAGGCGVAGWYGSAEARGRRALERLCRAYVASTLISTTLSAVARSLLTENIPDSELRVLHSTGELVLTLEVEDRPVELCLQLPGAYPLVPPKLQGSGVGAPPAQLCRGALRRVPPALSGALTRWARCVLARVECKPPCYICYCRLQPSSHRLPTLPCRQCGNRFHPECIRKWFATSQKSNCPLCRSIF